jgi:hypothetical protein
MQYVVVFVRSFEYWLTTLFRQRRPSLKVYFYTSTFLALTFPFFSQSQYGYLVFALLAT